MSEREKANQIIDYVDLNGIYEKINGNLYFHIERENDHYRVNISDSDITQDNRKSYSHTREGLEEFLTALLSDDSSILHRL